MNISNLAHTGPPSVLTERQPHYADVAEVKKNLFYILAELAAIATVAALPLLSVEEQLRLKVTDLQTEQNS